MEEAEHREPWLELEAMVDAGDAEQLDEYLRELPPGEPARALSRMDEERQAEVVGLLPEEDAAALLTELPDTQAVGILEHLAPEQAATLAPNTLVAVCLGGATAAAAEAVTRPRVGIRPDSHDANGHVRLLLRPILGT